MAACDFSIPFSGTPEDVLSKARSSVQGQGGTFNGNSDSGNFHVSVFGSTIAGSYNIVGNEIHISIADKPFLVPCSTIEGFLKSQLGA